MEAPEKIYLVQLPNGRFDREWFVNTIHSEDIEYTHTDAFIEKADKFISSFFHPDDNELKNGILDEFHKYMKGE